MFVSFSFPDHLYKLTPPFCVINSVTFYHTHFHFSFSRNRLGGPLPIEMVSFFLWQKNNLQNREFRPKPKTQFGASNSTIFSREDMKKGSLTIFLWANWCQERFCRNSCWKEVKRSGFYVNFMLIRYFIGRFLQKIIRKAGAETKISYSIRQCIKYPAD